MERGMARVVRLASAEFDAMVDAVRIGYITARDRRQHAKWTRKRITPKRGAGLKGEALEQAVMQIAAVFPDNVIRVVA